MARDATEVDSDQEVKSNQAEQLRVLISKKDKDDTDSDDVFREVNMDSFERIEEHSDCVLACTGT